LTGLANRTLFEFRLQQAFRRAARRREQLGVLFVDLDGFKLINDTLGHAAGDRLLVGVAERLSATTGPDETVARLGGDEFIVLMESMASPNSATRLAEEILAAMRQPFPLGSHEGSVRASIGIAIQAPRHLDPDDLIREADAAVYRAKRSGEDCYAVFALDADQTAAKAA
jgi:diguanylate cyclase (GGDEF)-like protein